MESFAQINDFFVKCILSKIKNFVWYMKIEEFQTHKNSVTMTL